MHTYLDRKRTTHLADFEDADADADDLAAQQLLHEEAVLVDE